MQPVASMRQRPVAPFAVVFVRFALVIASIAFPMTVQAAGTDAGLEIRNSAQASFSVSGVAQTPVDSNSTQTFVDELIDAVVVSTNAGPVGVSSPDSGAVLEFTVTNTGNGVETYRLIANVALGADDFNPALTQLYLETNSVPGLQIGASGDTPYLPPGNDPVLAEDESVQVYAVSTIPTGFIQNNEGALQLRAVSTTIIAGAGTDDPSDPAFPVPGSAYAGAGDPDEAGTGNVTAVVGATQDVNNLLINAEGRYVVSSAVVSLTKTPSNVVDPFGGATLVPGAVITYTLEVAVSGSGTAEALVITDLIPAELEYLAGTLAVSALPPGEDVDDDFAPVGVDNTGFDAGTQTVTVNLSDVAGGAPVITITFDAAIR
jgi:uncharacterized repeat protein (TIGR01451 family)